MKLNRFNIPAVAALAFGVFAGAHVAEAKCGPSTYGYSAYKARPYRAKQAAARTSEVPAAGAEVTIAGLWHTEFVAGGMVVDEGFDLWNSDGTEILNDTTTPRSGNVCLGVWAKTGALTYQLKHPSWIYDDDGVNLIGVVYLNQTITLDAGGDSYSGKLSGDVYDLEGNPLDHFESQIAATRIKAVTPAQADSLRR